MDLAGVDDELLEIAASFRRRRPTAEDFFELSCGIAAN
jgi:hypothetical protein